MTSQNTPKEFQLQQKKFRVLCLFDYACTTGFATVSHNIIAELRNHFQERIYLDIIAINYFGEHYAIDEITNIYSAIKLDEGEDPFGRNAFAVMAAKIDFDIIFCIQDIIFHSVLGKILKEIKKMKVAQNRKMAKMIVYFPVDGNVIKEPVNDLAIFDTLVTYTNYGKNKVAGIKPDWKPKIKVIPHGMNPKNFYRIEDREQVMEFRRDYFGDNADKTIITQVNRNQPRKDIPNSIFAFLDYKERFNKNAFYYMHMNATDIEGWRLRELFEQTPLVEGKDFMFLPDEVSQNGVDIAMLNLIYNSSDIFLTTTLGEGWGLSIAEAMQCHLPVVAPLHTSIEEITLGGKLIWGCEEFIPVSTHADSIIRERVDHREVAEKINECMTSNTERQEKIKSAAEYIGKMTWENVCTKWIDEFNKFV